MERYHDAVARALASPSLVVLFLLACVSQNQLTGPLTELGRSQLPTLTFSQLNIAFGDNVQPYSQWGAADLAFTGNEETRYFNLVVDGVWRIQNAPVLPLAEGVDGMHRVRFNFDLGVPSGAVVSTLSYAFDLTLTPLSQVPQGAMPATVTSAPYRLSRCLARSPILFNPPSPTLVGGQPAGIAIQRKNFPNQEAGVNECVPVAASNSLQWLDRRYKLGLNPADISIAAMKTATGWTPTGAAGEWWVRKNKYLTDKKIPISTANVSKTIDALVSAMKNGCDVELVVGNHAVAVSGVTLESNGNYTVVVANDTDQGKTDGRVSELLTFNPATKTFQGAPWNNGLGIGQLIVECKK